MSEKSDSTAWFRLLWSAIVTTASPRDKNASLDLTNVYKVLERKMSLGRRGLYLSNQKTLRLVGALAHCSTKSRQSATTV